MAKTKSKFLDLTKVNTDSDSSKLDFRKFYFLNKQDKQMRFRNSQDPIYGVFNVIDKQSTSKLFTELVKDLKFDIINGVKELIFSND